MPSDDSSVGDALNHQSLKVSQDDPGPRPMIAVLDARPGLAGPLREKIAGLAAQVRREPGCLAFTAYEARDVPGRLYLYEVYASTAAFAEHLQTQPVHDFIAAVPGLRPPIQEASCNSTRSPSAEGACPAHGATHAYSADRKDLPCQTLSPCPAGSGPPTARRSPCRAPGSRWGPSARSRCWDGAPASRAQLRSRR